MIYFFSLIWAFLFGPKYLKPRPRGVQIVRSPRRGWSAVTGAVSIVGGSGYQYGVGSAETGINCESYEVEYMPEVNEELQGIGGETFILARSTKFTREATIDGEVNAATGLMALTLLVAAVPANASSTYGDGTGGFYLQSATVTQNRKGWEKVSIKLRSRPGLA